MSKPDYRVYTVIKREDKDDYWLNLGVAFKHNERRYQLPIFILRHLLKEQMRLR